MFTFLVFFGIIYISNKLIVNIERSLNMKSNNKQVGDLFRESLYSANSVPEVMEIFSDKISMNFGAEDFLLLQMASQLKESAQIRKKAHEYMKMMSIISSECFKLINEKHPNLHFCTSQRFKSFISELYKRYERVQDGLSPEIKDLPALRIILLEDESQDILHIEYLLVKEILEAISILNTNKDFPLYVNLSAPDKSVTKSSFNPDEYPEVLLPNPEIILPGLDIIGKDYISNPKSYGYQSYHLTFELLLKKNSSMRIFVEIQIRTIAQHKYAENGPASHREYKKRRNEKFKEIFGFDKNNVHITGYYPNENLEFEKDFSGFSKPSFVTERSKTF